MDAQDRITFKRSTFKYGNSVGIVIPAQYKIGPKTVLKITISLADEPAETE